MALPNPGNIFKQGVTVSMRRVARLAFRGCIPTLAGLDFSPAHAGVLGVQIIP